MSIMGLIGYSIKNKANDNRFFIDNKLDKIMNSWSDDDLKKCKKTFIL